MVTFKYKSVANVMRETSMQTFYRIVRQSGPLSANVRRGPRTKHILEASLGSTISSF